MAKKVKIILKNKCLFWDELSIYEICTGKKTVSLEILRKLRRFLEENYSANKR